MIILLKDFLDVILHKEAAGTLFVLTVKVGDGILISFPVSGDGVVIFKSDKEVFGVAFLHILNSKTLTMSEKRMGHHLCSQRTGVVAAS